MNQELYIRFVEKYTKEVVEKSNGSVKFAYQYLRDKRDPISFIPHAVEKTYALSDLRNHFLAFRTMPMQAALDALGMMVSKRAQDPRRR